MSSRRKLWAVIHPDGSPMYWTVRRRRDEAIGVCIHQSDYTWTWRQLRRRGYVVRQVQIVEPTA